MPLHNLLERISQAPWIGVWVQAIRHYIEHQSGSQAGSIAFSTVLAMFPLLILVSATAAFIGQPGTAADMVMRVLEYAPPLVQQSVHPVIGEVLGHRSQALLAIGVFGTLWAASSGMQAVRTGVNKAYGVSRGLSFWKARIKVTLFTVVVGLGTLAAFSSVVVMPYVAQLIAATADTPAEAVWLSGGVRYSSAFVVLAILYALVYAWLPDLPQRLGTVLPGAIAGPLLWLGAAQLLSHVLRAAGKLMLVYGGFTGVVALLVFLYASAVTLLFGAELNGVLHRRAQARDSGTGG
ncbi:YihY/virulence factor BrkB family protein [Ideonella sp. BN130291]|uniref:YihY/virulence factor BrkB family protein n=1 Tax=Ideonella sp. BN130291 TaxID=3112940 RepID=UPI002E274679|nr:YihY/virulence factor BrkB family protein [Ideonella sp. BN130291]